MREDECDQAAAEEMVYLAVRSDIVTATQAAFLQALQALLAKDEYIWRGVYDDRRFDRHVRSCAQSLLKMAKANAGFEKLGRFRQRR